MTIEREDLSPHIGSVLHDVNLADHRDVERNAPEIRKSLAEREVIFFRGQHLQPDDLVALAGIFGEVQPVSSNFPHLPENPKVEVLKSIGKRTGTDVWHVDQSFHKEPPKGTCLLAVDVPPVGGDTMWASMTAAYDALDPEMKAYIENLKAIHDWETPEVLAAVRSSDDADTRYKTMREKYPPLEQPVVRVHPKTGKKVLFVNQLYTTHIVGLGRRESSSILSYLSSLSTVPEWQVRFHWKPGSVAVWDNHAVQHYAINDYHPYPRLMHRVTVN